MGLGDIFTELFYGEGALLGIILLFTITTLVSLKVRYSSIVFIIVWLFIAYEYLTRITATTLHAWYLIISGVIILFHVGIFINDLR